MATKWGIVSAGKISNDFVVALSTLNPTEHVVLGVAARNLENAKKFAATHTIPKYFDNYEKLAQETDIDVVYIGSINTEHKWIAKKMLENGKHILCEKPLCLNEKDTKELCDFAKSKKLFLMEAIWSRFFPAYLELQKIIQNGDIGEIIQINCNFGVPMVHVERVNKRNLGGGTIHDLGIYVLQFQQLFLGKKVEKIVALGQLNEEGMDENVSMILKHSGGKIAVLTTNSKVVESNVAEIMGTKGYIQIPNFWCPNKLILPTGTKTFELPPTKSFLNFLNSTGLSYEAQEVRRCILAGELESPTVSHEDTIHLAYLRDQIRREIGMVQDGDV